MGLMPLATFNSVTPIRRNLKNNTNIYFSPDVRRRAWHPFTNTWSGSWLQHWALSGIAGSWRWAGGRPGLPKICLVGPGLPKIGLARATIGWPGWARPGQAGRALAAG